LKSWKEAVEFSGCLCGKTGGRTEEELLSKGSVSAMDSIDRTAEEVGISKG
jgi:hypothetical protein